MHCVLPSPDWCEAFPGRHLLTRIRAEFLEMPGLRLTLLQMQRLCEQQNSEDQSHRQPLHHVRFRRFHKRSNGKNRSIRTDGSRACDARFQTSRLDLCSNPAASLSRRTPVPHHESIGFIVSR
jgi:hypothetical protein